MKIIEKNEGKKINYNLTGTKLDFADGALTLDLARYQQDDPVTRDIMVDSEGYLTTGRGLYYAGAGGNPRAEVHRNRNHGTGNRRADRGRREHRGHEP